MAESSTWNFVGGNKRSYINCKLHVGSDKAHEVFVLNHQICRYPFFMTNPGYRSHKKMEGGLKIEGQKSWLMVGHRAELMISGDYSKE